MPLPVALGPATIFGLVLSIVPLYGYFVHAARDSQQVGILILFCWLLTAGFAVYAVIALAMKRQNGKETARQRFFAAYFLVVCVIGYGGVNKAFFELIAG